jgi:hypothetical protein
MEFIKRHHIVSVFFIYVILTLIFTYPLTAKINSEIPKGGRDAHFTIAKIDKRVNVVKNEGFLQGFSTLTKNYELNTYFLYVFLNLFFNKFTSYNSMFLLSFILSGIGAYLLALYFTKSKPASFLAGLIYAFSPFHYYLAFTAQTGTMHLEWLPFFVLFLFKFFEKFELKYYLLFGLFLFIIALTEHHLLAFTAVFLIIFTIYKIIEDRKLLKNKNFWMYCLFSIVLLLLVAAALFKPLLKIATSESNYLKPDIENIKGNSMHQFAPLAPPIPHSIWSSLSEKIQKKLINNIKHTKSFFIGYSVAIIIVMIPILLLFKNNRNKIKFNGLIFWTVTTITLYILAMGPKLKLYNLDINLPYYLLYKYIPFYENIRSVERFYVYVILGFSILFAYGFWLMTWKHRRMKIIFTVILAVVILSEFWVAPIKTTTIKYSSFYENIRKDNEDYAILEIPGSTSYKFASFAKITDNIHGKRVINGRWMARIIKGQFDFQENTPIIRELLYDLPEGRNPEVKYPPEYFEGATEVLNKYNIRYVTVSKKFLKGNFFKNTVNFIEKYIEYDDKYEDEYLVAYKIKNIQ